MDGDKGMIHPDRNVPTRFYSNLIFQVKIKYKFIP